MSTLIHEVRPEGYWVPIEAQERRGTNASEEFHQLSLAKNSRTVKAIKYRQVISDLEMIRSAFMAGETFHTKWKWMNATANTLASDSWVGELYRKLSSHELAILLHTCEKIDLAVSTDGRDKTLRDLLLSPRISMDLKLGLTCFHHNYRSVALWLCLMDNGAHLPFVVNCVAKNEDPLEIQTDENNYRRTLAGIVSDAVVIAQGYNIDPSGRRVIDGLRHDLVTIDVLNYLFSMSDGRIVGNPDAASALAIHARKLYNLDDSVPDAWVIRMIS